MKVIPVIDLMGGVVVHAKKGDRDRYRPIRTPLCRGSLPNAVIDGILALKTFDTFYFADLDALMGKGDNAQLLDRLQLEYPGIRFWIDGGLPSMRLRHSHGNLQIVIGSESLDEKNLDGLENRKGEYILSLDFMNDCFMGPERLLQDPGFWPNELIVMSLSRVGANDGPDFRRLEMFRSRWPEKKIFAAGGVRNSDDLKVLETAGIDGVLVASALHSGNLDRFVLVDYP